MSMAIESAERRARNAELQRENAELRGAVISLQERIRDLEERLGKYSRNSSNPPSSDGLKRELPPKRERSKLRRGGQDGHQGHGRALVPVEEVDALVLCVPEACVGCGEALQGIDPTPERHQQVDIPEPKVLMTESQIHRLTCPRCGQVTTGELPAGVSRSRFGSDSPTGSRFVERILSTVATLSAQQRNVLDFLMTAHVNHIAGLPAPSLLPPQADPA